MFTQHGLNSQGTTRNAVGATEANRTCQSAFSTTKQKKTGS